MFERFTDRARRAVVLAQEEARALGHNYIGTEHVLLGLASEGQGIAAVVLTELGASPATVREQVLALIGRGTATPTDHIPFTPRAKTSLELALREALQLGHNYIGTEHVLLGLSREQEGVAAQVLSRLGATTERVRALVIQHLAGFQAAGGPGPSPSGPPGLPGRRWAPMPPPAPPLSLRTPAFLRVVRHATELSGGKQVGTHHFLAALASEETALGHSILAAGGFDVAALDRPPHEWDPSGTDDDTPAAAAVRATSVEVGDEEVVVRVTDESLLERLRLGELTEAVLRDQVAALWRTFAPLPPAPVEPPPTPEAAADVASSPPAPQADDPERDDLRCSFCGKARAEVTKLIAGPGVQICDQCVDLSRKIIDEEL